LRIVSDGIYYAGFLTVVSCLFGYFAEPWLSVPWLLMAGFCLYFFRDPERSIRSEDALLAPADGKVVAIRQLPNGETRISIFLNIFNVHVNRTPIAGTVREVLYRKGRFLVASHEAASLENEQNTLIIDSSYGAVICRQIAGLIARRIICYKHAGDVVAPGERIGYIKFGSRVDVIFGSNWNPEVKIGDKVKAGESLLAKPRQDASSAGEEIC
jgi:phosphatidylserine decarboxylase